MSSTPIYGMRDVTEVFPGEASAIIFRRDSHKTPFWLARFRVKVNGDISTEAPKQQISSRQEIEQKKSILNFYSKGRMALLYSVILSERL